MSWEIGDLCVVKSKQFGWTNNEIKLINKDVVTVDFIEYEGDIEVNISDLKPFGPFAVNRKGQLTGGKVEGGDYGGWKVGDACIAQWTQDGAWYNSKILHIFNEAEILVRFVDFGNADFTSLENLKPAGSPLENEVHQSRRPSPSPSTRSWSVGDRCVARWSEDGLWYKSEILAIAGQKVTVLFIQYGNEGLTTLDQLKPAETLEEKDENRTSWKSGDLCVAMWNEDNVWYNSQIMEINGDRVLVKFIDYGNEDYTTLQRLKPFGSLHGTLVAEEKKKKTWAVGDLCVARWEEDKIWYNSKIMEIDGERVLVQFVNYGNEDFTRLNLLKPIGTLELIGDKGKEAVSSHKQAISKDKGAIPKVKGTFPKVKKEAVSNHKEAISKDKGAIPKVKRTFPKVKKSSMPEEQLATLKKKKGTSEEKFNIPQEGIAVQLENIFPNISPEIILDMASKFGTIENAVNELLNYVPDETFTNKEFIAEKLQNMFPNFSPEILLDTARKCGNIDNAISELLNYVPDEDFSNEREDDNCVKERVAKSSLLLKEGDMFRKVTLTEKRDFNPDDPLENKFRLAKGHYLSVSGQFASPIQSIDYVENRTLMEIFERKKSQFKSQGKNAREYFLFHGTDDMNVDGILRENFQMDYAGLHGQAYGRGIYFSEKTVIPNKYMNGAKKTLLLCRVLLGREFLEEVSDIPEGFDSKSVQPDEDNRANINVIKDVEQILPCFVLNLTPSMTEFGDSFPTVTTATHRNMPQYGASSAIPTMVPRYYFQRNPSRYGMVTCPNDPSHQIPVDVIHIHLSKCKNRP